MSPVEYKWGVRVEKIYYTVFLGVGFTWLGEKALTIDFLFWSINIGRVYK